MKRRLEILLTTLLLKLNVLVTWRDMFITVVNMITNQEVILLRIPVIPDTYSGDSGQLVGA